MVSDLNDAINAETLHMSLHNAKLDFLEETKKHLDHIDPDRKPTSQEVKSTQNLVSDAKANSEAKIKKAKSDAEAKIAAAKK
mgnify:CR=1 FL=1